MTKRKQPDPYCTSLLPQLESKYPGIVDEYKSAASEEDERDDDGASDERVAAAPRLRMSRAAMLPQLFDYQEDLVSQFEELCTAHASQNVGLLTLPTGGGKTRTAVVALLRLLTAGRIQRALWLAPTRELLGQAMDTAESVWHEYGSACDIELLRADLLGGLPEDMLCGIYFSTPQMLAARIKSRLVPNVEVVVFDEAHHLGAPVFLEALSHMRDTRHAAIVGLSALREGGMKARRKDWLSSLEAGCCGASS